MTRCNCFYTVLIAAMILLASAGFYKSKWDRHDSAITVTNDTGSNIMWDKMPDASGWMPGMKVGFNDTPENRKCAFALYSGPDIPRGSPIARGWHTEIWHWEEKGKPMATQYIVPNGQLGPGMYLGYDCPQRRVK